MGIERSPDGGPGGEVAEQAGPVAQGRHLGHTAPAARQHHRHLHQQPTPVLAWCPLAGPRHRRRVGRSQPGAVSDPTETAGSTIDAVWRSPTITLTRSTALVAFTS